MSAVVVNVIEVNRRRHVELESIALALAEAIAAGETDDQVDDGTSLEPVRELRRALSTLARQPLPEALMAGTAEVSVELEAPAHELDAIAEELELLAAALEDTNATTEQVAVEMLAARLRHRALARS